MTRAKKEKVEKAELEAKPLLKAKKAFTISHNDYFREIKEGDDLSDVPALYHQNLQTEGVL